jgi:hypothetical protein
MQGSEAKFEIFSPLSFIFFISRSKQINSISDVIRNKIFVQPGWPNRARFASSLVKSGAANNVAK